MGFHSLSRRPLMTRALEFADAGAVIGFPFCSAVQQGLQAAAGGQRLLDGATIWFVAQGAWPLRSHP